MSAAVVWRVVVEGGTGRIGPLARVAELADAEDSKSSGREVVRVQVPPRAPPLRHRGAYRADP